MQVILPVAGLGTRLRPLTWSRPKPLLPVAGKPLIDHVLDRLAVLDLERVVFITGYLGDQIEAHVRSTYDVDVAFVEQREPLGQSHAILQARDVVSGPVIVLFPDMIFEADFSVVEGADVDGLLWVMPVDDPRRFGVVVRDGDRVARLVEKPDEPVSNLAVMGIYYFREAAALLEAVDRQLADDTKTKGEYFLADAIQLMIDDGATFASSEAAVWQDAGTYDALIETNRYLLDRIGTGEAPGGSVVIPPALIDPSATVERSVIGPHVSIGAGGRVVESIVSDSIIDAGARIEAAIVSGSIVGRDAVVRGRGHRLSLGDNSELDLAGRSVDG